jgi:nucleoside-diphosphate-sugar epimerase
MAKRADPSRRVIAVSRWTDRAAAAALEADGVDTLGADLLDPRALADLPDAPNVVFMAGQKFGTSGSPATTWAMNAAVPAFVAERYAGARTVVFSTGNVYPLTPALRGGSREDDAPAPVGEYAYSCLARERIFAAAAARHGTPVSIVRLNYAHDLRYGVLTDLAVRIARGDPVSLAMGFVNVIWQGDANAFALAALARASAPEPFIVNVAGPDTLRVADLARALGERLGAQPTFEGVEGTDALLSHGARMRPLLDHQLLPLGTLLDWVADWVHRGGRLLGKPTNFERRDGRF